MEDVLKSSYGDQATKGGPFFMDGVDSYRHHRKTRNIFINYLMIHPSRQHGYSRKIQTDGVEEELFWKNSYNFYRLVTSTLLLEIWQNYVTPLVNCKTKNQDVQKFHMISSWSNLEVALLFYLTPGIVFYNCIFSILLKISCPQPTSLDFFWNSLMRSENTSSTSLTLNNDFMKNRVLNLCKV